MSKENEEITRRNFLAAASGTALGLSAAAFVPPAAAAQENKEAPFDFLLLGDLHLDKLEHHDMEWLQREKPNDVRQVQNYSRITREVVPDLFKEVKGHLSANPRLAFTLHIGDFVEGLAGTPPLARRHCEDAVAFVRAQKLGKPFVFVKGNHDITGPGAPEAFDEILLPFVAREMGRDLKSSSFVQRRGDALFVYFDAYKPNLDWLEGALATRQKSDRHLFFVIHPPVVPYSARSTWHIYAKPEQAKERNRLLNLLGKNRAIVLCGHIHKYGVVVRETGAGPFVQLAVISVIPSPDVKPKDDVDEIKQYGPDVVRFEPNFSPETEAERRVVLRDEAPFIKHFQYADAPGYAVVSVRGARVTADIYSGLGRRLWRTVPLTDLLGAKG